MRERNPVAIDDAARKQAIGSIRRYFSENLDDDVGDLKAALLLDYVLAEIGPTIYNQALADARRFFEERAADLDAMGYRSEFPFWATPSRSSEPARGKKR